MPKIWGFPLAPLGSVIIIESIVYNFIAILSCHLFPYVIKLLVLLFWSFFPRFVLEHGRITILNFLETLLVKDQTKEHAFEGLTLIIYNIWILRGIFAILKAFLDITTTLKLFPSKKICLSLNKSLWEIVWSWERPLSHKLGSFYKC